MQGKIEEKDRAQFAVMRMKDDPYALIAAYYDAMHASLQDDVGLVLSLAADGGPILELGCGTGRLLLPVARAGYGIVGVDRSLSMLRYARERLQQEPPEVRERANLLCADMGQFALGQEPFRLAMIPYNTLMHVDAAQLPVAFANIGRHLARDGQLFIDVVNPLAVEQTPNDHFLTLEKTFEDPRRGELVVVMASNELDAARQQLRITWIFDATPRQGGPITRRVARVDYTYYFAHQLALALEEAGMEVAGLFGNYRLDPFEEDAERLLVLARRVA